MQLTQASLARMATTIDSAALLTYRAAWQRDQGEPVTREAAMAKYVATEGAQEVIDAALQLVGRPGRQVRRSRGAACTAEIRAVTHLRRRRPEVQQLIIARELLRDARATSTPPSISNA
ncbi:acyl-CoA dehydrogenase family protein [Gemmatimonas sp.]|uniref:acyl-CoA dehydrogenase family protein n=1 Tax=Gemmatimonas sp. TaxID=1962908 RepID=UPI003DA516C2